MLPRLYNLEISGNCYKVRLLFSLLSLDYEKIPIGKVPGSPTSANDVPPGFLKLNPRGQIPVLEMDGQVIWDSTAILIYIARRHGGEQWFPLCANDMARVAQWLALAQNDILFGVARARSIRQGRQAASLEDAERFARRAMATLQSGLEGSAVACRRARHDRRHRLLPVRRARRGCRYRTRRLSSTAPLVSPHPGLARVSGHARDCTVMNAFRVGPTSPAYLLAPTTDVYAPHGVKRQIWLSNSRCNREDFLGERVVWCRSDARLRWQTCRCGFALRPWPDTWRDRHR